MALNGHWNEENVENDENTVHLLLDGSISYPFLSVCV